MALTTILFIAVYAVCLVGSIFYHPMLGVIGYAMTYNISPANQWWGEGLASMGMRYSFFMAAAIAIGMLFQKNKIRWPGKLHRQEVLFFLLVAWIFISTYTGLPGAGTENFGIKLAKVAVFLWMLCRIVTDLKRYEIFIVSLIMIGLYLGYNSLSASTAFYGRIDSGIGGSDFAEGNFLAAHFAMLLPFIGAFFMQGSRKTKVMTFTAAVLVVNGIVLCRSRGVFLAVGAGAVAAMWYAPREWRGKVAGLMIVGMIGAGVFLVDQGFIDRMRAINPSVTDTEEMDASAANRILAWKASLQMVAEHPLGIGQDNFSRYVGDYQPAIPGKDTHNTFLRNLAELGIPGFTLYLLMIWTAFQTLRKLMVRIKGMEREAKYRLHIYAQTVALVIFLSAGLFITHTYIEELYWLLFFPLILEKAVENEVTSQEIKHSFAGALHPMHTQAGKA